MDIRVSILLLCAAALSSLRFASSSPELGICDRELMMFRCSIEAMCPRSLYPNPPLEVDGDYLDRTMESKHGNGYMSVLFYASWCPFSRAVRPKFDALSLMFPQIEHLAVEHSRALPSVFSRYGVHSLPVIMMVNKTSMVRYKGEKDLTPLIQFYEITTGVKPVQYAAEEEQSSSDTESSFFGWIYNRSSWRELVKREPYLLFAVFFVVMRLAILVMPRMISRMKAIWASYVPRRNLGILRDTSQHFGRALHMIDVRRIWMKLRLIKTSNFHERTKNARAWVSSLASVSLGKSSSQG